MADEAQATQTAPPVADAAPPPEAAHVATPQSDPTPAQEDSKLLKSSLDREIDDLWSKAEGKPPKQPDPAPKPEPAEKPPEAKAPEPKPTDAPKPADDPAELRRQAYEQAKADYEAQEKTKADADRRVKAEVEQRQQYEAYIGPDTDYQAVNTALRQALIGDASALDALDVVLPNGQKVSQVKGAAGLTQDEAANLLNYWDTARKYEGVMGDRKVRQLVDLWNADIISGRVLDHPDVDAASVTKHDQPHDQMAALRDSVIERVTKRLTDQHAEVVKAKDAEIAKLNERVSSLVNERGNLASRQLAAGAASVDRPGQPGTLRTDLPDPESFRRMPADQAFESGTIDRLLRSIPGGQSSRRAG